MFVPKGRQWAFWTGPPRRSTRGKRLDKMARIVSPARRFSMTTRSDHDRHSRASGRLSRRQWLARSAALAGGWLAADTLRGRPAGQRGNQRRPTTGPTTSPSRDLQRRRLQLPRTPGTIWAPKTCVPICRGSATRTSTWWPTAWPKAGTLLSTRAKWPTRSARVLSTATTLRCGG